MGREIHLFFVALSFYTRIPCPGWVEHSGENMRDSSRYLVLTGWVVGAGMFAVLWAAMQVFPEVVAVVLATLSGVLLTGGMHEDGLADVCDGFGGGWTKERILAIMKDSQVGVYGVQGIVFSLGLKVLLIDALLEMVELWWVLLSILLVGCGLSRMMAYLAMGSSDYVRRNGEGKCDGVVSGDISLKSGWVVVAGLVAISPMVVMLNWWLTLPVLAVVLTQRWMLHYFEKRIGGYTGDCLGAIIVLSELMFYLVLVGVWRYF